VGYNHHMAGIISFPDDAKAYYAALAEMPADQYQRLLEFVAGLQAEKVISVTLDRRLRGQRQGDRSLFFGVINHLARLSRTARTAEISSADAIEAAVEQSVPANSESRATLSSRLKELFAQEFVGLHFRAWELLYEEQRYISRTSIITDVRPVFNVAGDAIEGHIIVNHLHIVYKEDNETRNLFFALDEDDISQLSAIAARAKTKAEALKALPIEISARTGMQE
jgi:hypothetical protein